MIGLAKVREHKDTRIFTVYLVGMMIDWLGCQVILYIDSSYSFVHQISGFLHLLGFACYKFNVHESKYAAKFPGCFCVLGRIKTRSML